MIDKSAIISVIKNSLNREDVEISDCALRVQNLLRIVHAVTNSYYLISLDLIREFSLGEEFENHIKYLRLNRGYTDSTIFELVCYRILNNERKAQTMQTE